MPTTESKDRSTCCACTGIASLTVTRTLLSRTCGPTPGSREPLIATPSIHATMRTATTLSTEPPRASTARTGCQVIWSRIRLPANWKSAWPIEASTRTTNSAPSETHSEGAASPSSSGASRMPAKPPSTSPAVANAPVTKPCQ